MLPHGCRKAKPRAEGRQSAQPAAGLRALRMEAGDSSGAVEKGTAASPSVGSDP